MTDGQSDLLDELLREDTAAPAKAEPEPVEPEVETLDEPQARERDDKGRFKSKDADEGASQNEAPAPAKESEKGGKPEAAEAAEPEPPSGEDEDQDHVPKSVVIALRKELQALKAQQKAATPGQAPQSQPEPAPKGPEFSLPQSEDGEIDPGLFAMKMQMSQMMAAQAYSEQEVNEAWSAFDQAAQTDPTVNAISWALRNHPNPMVEVVKWHRQQKWIRDIETAGDPDKWFEQRMAQMQAEQTAPAPTAAAPAPKPKPASPTPPPSLASGGNGQSEAPLAPSEDETFDALFGEKKTRKR